MWKPFCCFFYWKWHTCFAFGPIATCSDPACHLYKLHSQSDTWNQAYCFHMFSISYRIHISHGILALVLVQVYCVHGLLSVMRLRIAICLFSSWYHPNSTRHIAESLLMQNSTDGAYLLRPSSHPGELALSVRLVDAISTTNC